MPLTSTATRSPAARWIVAGDRLDHAVGNLVGRLQRPAVGARFTVDPDADLHLTIGQHEGRLTGCGQDRR